jgi:hypothetical protein
MSGAGNPDRDKGINWVAVGSLAAAAAAAVAFFGLFHSNNPSGGTTATPTGSAGSAPPFPTASGGSSGFSTTPSPSPSSIQVRNRGPLIVGDSYDTYDLDSTSSNWGEGSTFGYNAEFTAYGGNELLVEPVASYKQVPNNSKVEFSTCEGTGYGGNGELVKYTDLSVGEKLCFKTTEGRVSLLNVQSVSAESLTFYATTWQPARQ